MAVTKDELVEAIAKLNDLTRRKAIVWTALVRTLGGTSFYSTTYEGRRLRVSELPRSGPDVLYHLPKPARCILEILDDSGNPVYEFPDVQGITDLFASVRAQQSDVDVEGLIKSLLTSG